MKTKHTPGPLRYTHGEKTQVLRSDGTPIATIHSSVFDAALFAAAPELFDVVKWLAEFCCLSRMDRNDPTVAKVWAAIAKAEGSE